VIAVHCKAGKGRTGLMICCWLIHSQTCATSREAIELFGKERTKDRKVHHHLRPRSHHACVPHIVTARTHARTHTRA
jgi:protein-tyrosine phosphatase